MTKAELHKAVTLPCYPLQLMQAIDELELTWAAEHAGIKHGTLLDGGINQAKQRIIIITFREL